MTVVSARVLAVTALMAAACGSGAGSSPASPTATTTAGLSVAPTEVFTSAAVAPSARGVLLDTTRASDDVALTVTSPVRRGRTAIATATTASNAMCTIAVTYASGPSTAEGLGPKNTDGAGGASWSWTVGADTSPGSWTVEVSCGLASGQRTVGRAMLVVE